MRRVFPVVGSLYVPTNSAHRALAMVVTWDQQRGEKQDASERKRMNMGTRG